MTGERPLVSVILPVRNEARHFEQCLTAVLGQSYPHHLLEVLVVDGESTDGTVAIARRLAQASDVRVAVIDNPRRTAAAALNLGIERAGGGVIARVDGHCLIGPHHIATAVAALSDETIGCVGGAILTVGEDPRSRAIAAAMSSRFGVGGSTFRVGGERARDVDTVPFPVFRRDTLERIGRFDEDLDRNQDDEYNFRLRHRGLRVRLVPGLAARYFARSGLRGLCRQYFDYGRYKVRVLQLHPRQMSPRHFAPPSLVAALALGLLVAAANPWPALLLLAAYAAVLGAAAARLAWREPILGPSLFAALVVLHVAYGSGFWCGLWQFRGGFKHPAPRPGAPLAEGS